jgi:uncharacterized protein (TIGR02996 family)
MPADHPDYLALVRAVIAAPDDDTPRLAAADWLDEYDRPDRAAFIRAQVELARLEAAGQGATSEAEALRKREYVYLGPRSDLLPLWAVDDCPQLVRLRFRGGGPLDVTVDGADRLFYRRGFVEKVVCPAGEWRHHAAAIRGRQPVREVFLTGCGGLVTHDWLRLLPAVRGLRRVVLDLAELPPGTAPLVLTQLRAWLPDVTVAVSRPA